jgi:hypothetical protein
MRYLLLLVVPFLVVACDDSNTEADSGPVDAGSVDAGGNDAGTMDAGTQTFTLTIDDYLSWCNVSENGGAASSLATTSATFPSGTVVNLHADAISSTFIWGYWVGTDADTGSNDTNMTATATLTADKTVKVCCPFQPPASQTCPF